MRTPITYYGGKQKLASTILAMIPAHRIYVEPYFGGGAVFFAKCKSYLEVVNDINDKLITFYEVCQSEEMFPLLMSKVQKTLHSESLFQNAYSLWKNPDKCNGNKVDLAWAVWVATNMSFNGSPLGGWRFDNGTTGSHSGITMDHYRQKFSGWIHNRLKNVQISCRDALTVIDQRDREETFFFLDPPYPGSEQKRYKGFTFEHLEQLLEMLAAIKGRFLLCNYHSDLLQQYVDKYGWNMSVNDLPLLAANLNGKGRRKQEVMVWNYDVEYKLFE